MAKVPACLNEAGIQGKIRLGNIRLTLLIPEVQACQRGNGLITAAKHGGVG